MEERFAELKSRLAEIHDVRRAMEMLFWDQTVMMPPGGGAVRGAQVTTLDRIQHEKFIADEIGELLGGLADYEQQLDYDSDEASLIRTTRRDWNKARRVPAELAAEITGAAAEAHDVWAKARQDNDFALFLPYLERAVELKRRYIDCFEGYDEPYSGIRSRCSPTPCGRWSCSRATARRRSPACGMPAPSSSEPGLSALALRAVEGASLRDPDALDRRPAPAAGQPLAPVHLELGT
jgi:hypothetical protein